MLITTLCLVLLLNINVNRIDLKVYVMFSMIYDVNMISDF